MSCQYWLDNRNESEENYESRDYSIDPETLLEALDRGDTDVFTLLDPTPETLPTPSFSGLTPWSQADYFRFAQALYQESWQEPFEAKNIYFMNFEMDCAEIEQGLFSYVILNSFEIIQTGEEETRVEYHNVISPSRHWVSASRGEYTPNIQKKEPLDLTRYRISAEEIVQIAEKNGGAERRLLYENDCKINALAPGLKGKGWVVSYKNDNDGWRRIFEITIDPQIGAFEVLHPKP